MLKKLTLRSMKLLPHVTHVQGYNINVALDDEKKGYLELLDNFAIDHASLVFTVNIILKLRKFTFSPLCFRLCTPNECESKYLNWNVYNLKLIVSKSKQQHIPFTTCQTFEFLFSHFTGVLLKMTG